MQDPNPLPWGALDRYQAHFIVTKEVPNPSDYVAKTILKTAGHFGGKRVVSVNWDGSYLARTLNADSELCDMIAKLPVRDAQLFVEPTEGAIRIRNKWKNHLEFGITEELFEIYDRIAGHIKKN